MSDFSFHPLPLPAWQETRDTVQKYCQVLGEVRGALAPRQKHWWHINLRPGVRGLTTPPVPAGIPAADARAFRMTLDFLSHELVIEASDGACWRNALRGQSTAHFCRETLAALQLMGISVQIDENLLADENAGEYDRSAVATYWHALSQIAMIFERFRSSLRQETSPVNLWPHHFDLALVWFSGRLVPDVDPADEEHADEQMSFGFSTGDSAIPEPYFYISAYPMPDGLAATALPDGVSWYTESWHGALMRYDVLVQNNDPGKKLLTTLSLLHQAGAKLMQRS
jgi:hypothetical protein